MKETTDYETTAEYELVYLACLLLPEITPAYFTSLVIEPHIFQSDRNSKIYKAMLKQAGQGLKPDIVTLANDSDLAEIEKSYIGEITNHSFSLANISFYENAIITAWKKRETNRAIEKFKIKINAPENAENIDPALQEFQEMITKALGDSAERGAFLTFDDYINAQAVKEYWREFTPRLFGGKLPFPDGTISAIGAAPGGGKSAALVNLCRELLTTEQAHNPTPSEKEKAHNINAKRKMLFISAEMSAQDLTDRLIRSLAWQTAGAGQPYCLETVEHTNIDYWKLLKKEYGTPPDYWEFTQQELSRAGLYKNVIEKYIRPALGNRLKIVYVRGKKSFDDIYNIILNNAKSGSLVLLDYLQLMPICFSDIGQGNPRYLEIRHIMDMGIMAAEKTQSVIIAAAQLGREDRRNGNNGDDTQGWRESGDIEQTAWNLIKMTRERKERGDHLSFKIVKARSSEGGGAYSLDWIPGYQYMANTGEKYVPPE
jgi:replicative DNA helicase